MAHGSTALIHFSGGADSTLSAALFAERFDVVHLVTYDRLAFIGADAYTMPNYDRLRRAFGPDKFRRVLLPVGRWHKAVCYDRYASFARRHGLAVTALTFSKLAMHWRSAVYCLQNSISTVGDGAVPYMDLYPDQNMNVCLRHLRAYYEGFGIRYENPVHGIAESVERTLYDKGISDHPETRGTDDDRQVFYAEQVLLAFFIKYYVTARGKAGYEAALESLFAEKIDFMRETVEAWRKAPQSGLVAAMLR